MVIEQRGFIMQGFTAGSPPDGQYFKLAPASNYGIVAPAMALVPASGRSDAAVLGLDATGRVVSSTGLILASRPNPGGTQLDPKLQLVPSATITAQSLDVAFCALTPRAGTPVLRLTCNVGSPVKSVFWWCGGGDILGIETRPLGCPVYEFNALPPP